ncbi:MAG: RHS repeat-associated core domain-containing protein [Saprospiraceae bacterium]|nr:RHS repeat-associated core domain-containing protein [Saprospiraceae bacterium]
MPVKLALIGEIRAITDGVIVDTIDVLREAHYYPFGMEMVGPWSMATDTLHPYLYNGKEFNHDSTDVDEDGKNELALGWYDYGARFYDPAVARFTGVDPLAANHYAVTPFAYVLNNPLKYIDPFGLDTLPSNFNYIDVLKHVFRDKYTTALKEGAAMIKNGVFTFFTGSNGDEGATQRGGSNLTSKDGPGPLESEVEALDGANESIDVTEFTILAGNTKFMKMPTSPSMVEAVDLGIDIIQESKEVIDMKRAEIATIKDTSNRVRKLPIQQADSLAEQSVRSYDGQIYERRERRKSKSN